MNNIIQTGQTTFRDACVGVGMHICVNMYVVKLKIHKKGGLEFIKE